MGGGGLRKRKRRMAMDCKLEEEKGGKEIDTG